MEWQPINTAPKDGTPVLVGWNNGFWHAVIAHKEERHWGVLGGSGGKLEFTTLMSNPTHWMPLPRPPSDRDEV